MHVHGARAVLLRVERSVHVRHLPRDLTVHGGIPMTTRHIKWIDNLVNMSTLCLSGHTRALL